MLKLAQIRAEPAVDRIVSVADWNGDAAGWDAFVAADERSTFCHLAGWHDVMAGALDAEPIFLRALDNGGGLVGVLPLAFVRSTLFGRFLVSMPFLNYGGPLGSDSARRCLVEAAADIAATRRARLLELRTRHGAEPPLREETRRLTVLLPLPDQARTLWDGFPSKLRSQIRRPMKAGLNATCGAEQLEDFYRIFAHTMRDLGTPVLPFAFFRSVATAFGDRAVICTVRRPDGEPVAAGFGFEWRGEVEITWAGALRVHSAEAPNMLLYWAFMEESIRRGAHSFNFGRCRPDGGTHRFKRQWGGHDVPLPWSVWSRSRAGLPSPERSGYGLASRVWTHLPLPIANTLGPILSRCIP